MDIALPEQDNFRGALAWALPSESIALGLEIATALEQLWTLDDPNEGIRWFERLFARPDAELVSPSLRAEALRAYGSSPVGHARVEVLAELVAPVVAAGPAALRSVRLAARPYGVPGVSFVSWRGLLSRLARR